MSKAIGVLIDGVVEWHAPGNSGADYDTLCGIDANDPSVGHCGTISPSRAQKIECIMCKTMYLNFKALKLKDSDFA